MIESARTPTRNASGVRPRAWQSRAASLCAALLWMMLATTAALAGDPVAGKALFNHVPEAIISCANSSCHGPNPNDNVNDLQQAGNNAGIIEAAIRVSVKEMMFLNGLLNPFQLEDLAAYLAPQPDLSATALDFGSHMTGANSAAQKVTLTNLGGVDLGVTGVALSGPGTGFSLGGSCITGVSLQSAILSEAGERPGGACDLTVSFSPGSPGTHAASVTLTYAGTRTFPSQQTISLAGKGIAPAAPVAAVDRSMIDFGDTLREATAQPRRVVVSNPGTGPLRILGVDVSGRNGGEFGLSGTCVAFVVVHVPAGGSCFAEVGFSPQGIGPREATLNIRHDAAGGPAVVALRGTGIAASCPQPAPGAEFQTLACPAGQSGLITQSRASVCSGSAWIPGMWITVADNCRAHNSSAPLELAEYYNAGLNHYFVTADPAERAGIDAGLAGPGWIRTKLVGRVWSPAPTAGLIAVCRFYGNPAAGPDGKRLGPNSHFYTADPGECEAVKADPGWLFEGTVFSVVAANGAQCPAPLKAVRRSYNGRFRENDSNHRYASDPADVGEMTSRGWIDEGVVFCVSE